MSTPRLWLYGLTADEWLHLAAEGQDSEVAPCCGNISDLREHLNALATCQGAGESGIMLKAVLESYEMAAGSHDEIADAAAFPLLHRVLAGIRAEQARMQEQARAYQESIRARREP
jgi:glutathione S-transferase